MSTNGDSTLKAGEHGEPVVGAGSTHTMRNAMDAMNVSFGTGPCVAQKANDEVSGEAEPGSDDRLPHGTGRYQVLAEIARGGMGAVLRGRDGDLNRELAIKVLLEKYAENPEVVGRFVEEAQIGAQLQHPGIVPVYDVGQFPDRRPFFAMKLVRGRTLAALLKKRTAPADDLPRFLKIFEQICETMAYAHAKGVIHRDLKPVNVMVGAFGEVQVMDWGLAKVLDRSQNAESPGATLQVSAIRTKRSEEGSDPTAHGAFLGTAAHMPPEQARGDTEALDERADVFSLGSILCQILTGEPAYTGRSSQEIVTKAMTADLNDALSRLGTSGADPKLIAIAESCLAKAVEDRPRDAGEVAGLTSSYLAGVQERLRNAEVARVEATARAETEKARAEAEAARAETEKTRRKMTMAAAASVMVALLIGGGAWMAFRLDRAARIAETQRVVSDALVRAEDSRTEAQRAGGNNLDAWARALAAADKARDLLAGRLAMAGLAARVDALRADAARQVAAARAREERRAANRRLVVAIEEARLEGAGERQDRFDAAAKIKAYEAAFRQARIDIMAIRPDEMTHLFTPEDETDRIAAALDDWAHTELDSSRRGHLFSLAKHVDPDPFRNRLRDAIQSRSEIALVGSVTPEQVASLPAASLEQLAHIASFHGGFHKEAIRLLTLGRASYPSDFWIHEDLGELLLRYGEQPDLADAVRFLTVGVALRPGSPGALNNLGSALLEQDKRIEAEGFFRRAIQLKPDYAGAYNNLGNSLDDRGFHSQAIDMFQKAIRLKPDLAEAHFNLGIALNRTKKVRDAAAEYREAIRLNPKYFKAYNNLSHALAASGKYDEAIVAVREAIRLRADYPNAHFHLGSILRAQKKYADAAEAFRQAARLKPDYAEAHYFLGNALRDQRKNSQAINAYHEAIRLRPDYAEAYCNLGWSLRQMGRYSEAIANLRRGDELGSKRSDWKYPSGSWVKECAALVEIESRLPSLLAGRDNPKDNAERLALGEMCYDKRLYAASARFRGAALSADSRLRDDRKNQRRYNAACSAALAGSGAGEDDPKPDDATRAKLRQQARGWLREELAAWSKVLELGTARDRADIATALPAWKTDTDLAGVRDAAALGDYPEEERRAWQALWGDVAQLLEKAGQAR